jgi:hypothetical protein
MAVGEQSGAKLLSDFDGTAVELVGKLNPRNWLKYPLAGIPGYREFLEGVQEGGVDVDRVVSRRPNIPPRRLVTARSIADLGLQRFFPDSDSMVLAWSETGKASFVVEEAQKGRPVGMIDDKPHRVGPALLSAMREVPLESGWRRISPITLGVVNHERSEEYMMDFIEGVQEQYDEIGISVTERVNDHSFALRPADYRFRLNVVGLPEYSAQAGEAFAQRLLDT